MHMSTAPWGTTGHSHRARSTGMSLSCPWPIACILSVVVSMTEIFSSMFYKAFHLLTLRISEEPNKVVG